MGKMMLQKNLLKYLSNAKIRRVLFFLKLAFYNDSKSREGAGIRTVNGEHGVYSKLPMTRLGATRVFCTYRM